MKIKPAKRAFKLPLGERGEMIAADFLINQQYKILDKKVRAPFGELDLVAQIKDVLVFIEVKTRSTLQSGLPEEAVDLSKQKQLVRLAEWYFQKNSLHKTKMRFDVISILYSGTNEPKIRHIPNAFGVL